MWQDYLKTRHFETNFLGAGLSICFVFFFFLLFLFQKQHRIAESDERGMEKKKILTNCNIFSTEKMSKWLLDSMCDQVFFICLPFIQLIEQMQKFQHASQLKWIQIIRNSLDHSQ